MPNFSKYLFIGNKIWGTLDLDKRTFFWTIWITVYKTYVFGCIKETFLLRTQKRMFDEEKLIIIIFGGKYFYVCLSMIRIFDTSK